MENKNNQKKKKSKNLGFTLVGKVHLGFEPRFGDLESLVMTTTLMNQVLSIKAKLT